MNWFSFTPKQLAAGQIALAAMLAVAGFVFLLPRPKGRALKEGIASLIASVAVFVAWLSNTFGRPMPDAVGTVLFCLFAAGALGFGVVLVVQKNPARGAIAFAFVILSTCGLFLLLAAPFLMAATIIIYAGAIIVTFLFVLMLSHAQGPSNENDRTREPLFGSLAGFAFTGLVLFALYLTQLGNDPLKAPNVEIQPTRPDQRLPVAVLTNTERMFLAAAIAKLETVDEHVAASQSAAAIDYFENIRAELAWVVGSDSRSQEGSIRFRLEKAPTAPGEKFADVRRDQQSQAVLRQAEVVRRRNEQTADALENLSSPGPNKPTLESVKAAFHALRDDVLLLYGSGELPARNVGNIGYLLFTNHLLAVELAGALLLVATIGAIAIAQRKGAAS
jgi:NADH:ubiquinone oxidoreductase subunit 6 (subunit J)